MKSRDNQRLVWSCAFLAPPEETTSQRLEEQLVSRTLDYWQDARALDAFLRCGGLSQAEGARRLGRSQAAVANRLRLLKLPKAVMERAETDGITERHARALLRLGDEASMLRALELIEEYGWNVAETEQYVDRQRTEGFSHADELFAPLLAALRELRAKRAAVSFAVEETEDAIELTIRLPRDETDEK